MSSISPVSLDPEKTAYGHDAPVYVIDEGIDQAIEAEEFGETKELRASSLVREKPSPEEVPWEHCYTFVRLPCVRVVMSIAEMNALLPLSGGIIRHAEHFVDPALSFANGWNTVYGTMVNLPAELVAAAVVVQFWNETSSAIWITVFGALLVISNLFFVRVYGELEFTFASLKIMLIIGLNIMALVVTCGGGSNHNQHGFQYWHNPGPFVDYLGYTGNSAALGHFLGFWTTFNNAVYAYSGIEGISLAAAETQAPRRNIPIAAKRIFWRVSIFYAAQSPFVIAATSAGIKVVPSIINAIVLTSAWSAGNSGLLGGSRTLFGLAREGRPVSIALEFRSASIVFGWFQDLVSVAALVNWMVICIVYLRFYYGMKKQGIPRTALPWKGPFQPHTAWTSLVSFFILLLTGGYVVFIHGNWDNETLVSSCINIPIILILYFGFKFWKKTKIIPLSEIPIQHFIDIADENPELPAKPVTGWRRFNVLQS